MPKSKETPKNLKDVIKNEPKPEQTRSQTSDGKWRGKRDDVGPRNK